MSRISTLAALAFTAIAGAAAVASPAAAKVCQSSVCAESRSDGRMVNVYISFNGRNYTHFNVRRNGGQVEVAPGLVYQFAFRKGYNQYYSVQVCNRGGLFQTSTCGGWVRFYHTS